MEERFPEGTWPVPAYPIADRFLELLETDATIVAATRQLHERCLVLRIDVGSDALDRPTLSFTTMTRKLKPLVLAALRGGNKAARATLRRATGVGGGHLGISVLLLENRELAKERCERMVEEAERDAARAEKRRDQIRSLLEPIASQPFARRVSRLKQLRQLVHEEIAGELESAFNLQLRSMPQETYAEKGALAIWANQQLRDLGLAVRCPKTGLPGILIADTAGADSPVRRLRLEVRDDSGRRVRTHVFSLPLELSLMPDRNRVEGLARSPR